MTSAWVALMMVLIAPFYLVKDWLAYLFKGVLRRADENTERKE